MAKIFYKDEKATEWLPLFTYNYVKGLFF